MAAVQRKAIKRLIKPQVLTNVRAFQTVPGKKQIELSAAAATLSKEVLSEYDSAKPFGSIPGPKPMSFANISNILKLMSFGNNGQGLELSEMFKTFYEEYGPIVKFSGPGVREQVLLFDPEGVEKMFRNESIWPYRFGLQSLNYYRSVLRKDFYKENQGLVTSQGEDWQRFRSATNQVMLQPRLVNLYVNSVDDVCHDFLTRIRFIRKANDEMPEDFLNEINKLSLENFALISLDTRLGCLRNDLKPDSDALKMINSVKETMGLMYKLDYLPSLWKMFYFPTPSWRKFVRNSDFILEFTMKHINEKWEKLKTQKREEGDTSNRSILESLLAQTNNPAIPIVMTSDTLFAAIDTTSNTLATVLYYLAINPDKQEILFDELKRVLPEKDSRITSASLNDLKYTRAAIKEGARLSPTVVLNQRGATKDLVLLNYQIPKGTNLLACQSIMCRMSKYFKNPDEFIPERWLKSNVGTDISAKNAHPFVYLPFGFGQRSCIGKRLAYLELDVAIAKIIRNFKISYHYEPMTWVTRLVTAPSKPLKFKMTERMN